MDERIVRRRVPASSSNSPSTLSQHTNLDVFGMSSDEESESTTPVTNDLDALDAFGASSDEEREGLIQGSGGGDGAVAASEAAARTSPIHPMDGGGMDFFAGEGGVAYERGSEQPDAEEPELFEKPPEQPGAYFCELVIAGQRFAAVPVYPLFISGDDENPQYGFLTPNLEIETINEVYSTFFIGKDSALCDTLPRPDGVIGEWDLTVDDSNACFFYYDPDFIKRHEELLTSVERDEIHYRLYQVKPAYAVDAEDDDLSDVFDSDDGIASIIVIGEEPTLPILANQAHALLQLIAACSWYIGGSFSKENEHIASYRCNSEHEGSADVAKQALQLAFRFFLSNSNQSFQDLVSSVESVIQELDGRYTWKHFRGIFSSVNNSRLRCALSQWKDDNAFSGDHHAGGGFVGLESSSSSTTANGVVSSSSEGATDPESNVMIALLNTFREGSDTYQHMDAITRYRALMLTLQDAFICYLKDKVISYRDQCVASSNILDKKNGAKALNKLLKVLSGLQRIGNASERQEHVKEILKKERIQECDMTLLQYFYTQLDRIVKNYLAPQNAKNKYSSPLLEAFIDEFKKEKATLSFPLTHLGDSKLVDSVYGTLPMDHVKHEEDEPRMNGRSSPPC